ncbi:MAG: cytochrome c oxidase assembly protein [Candidatus Nanopelagicales bacterium]
MTAPAVAPRAQLVRELRPGPLLLGSTAIALVVMAACLWAGDGRPVPSPAGLPDAGLGTEWALPVVRTVADLAGILTVGLLLAGGLLVPAREGVLRGPRLKWTRAARWSALVWAGAVVVQVVLTLSNVLAQPVPGILDPALLWSFVRDIEIGRSLLVQAVLALVVGVAAYAVRTTTGAALTCLVALAALLPPTLSSHSGTSPDHTVAVSGLAIHVLSLSLWCGGLVALVLLGTSDRRPLAVAVSRFSPLALWTAVAVGATGILSAWVRLSSPSDLLTTSYGRLVLLKALLLAVLAAFGFWHRRATVPKLAADPTRLLFLRVAAVEVLVMAATVGVAVALSRTPPPVSGSVPISSLTPAQVILGFPMPPELTVANLLWGQARADALWLLVCLVMLGLYAAGVRAVHRAGGRWSWGRTASWLVGVALLALCTVSGVATYGHVLFSVHMTQHMVLSMVTPIFLVLAAPITLALETLPRDPARVGPREWLERFVASRFVKVLTHPLTASALFLAGFYLIYLTPVFPWLMSSHWGHIVMNAGFLLVGVVFYWVMIGIDPGPQRPPFMARFVIMVIVMALHSFFAVVMMSTTSVVAEAFYRSLQRPYALDLLADQHVGAMIGWGSGDIPMIIVMGAMFVQWVRADEREARRSDTAQEQAARTGEGTDELADYNAYLAELARRSGGTKS